MVIFLLIPRYITCNKEKSLNNPRRN